VLLDGALPTDAFATSDVWIAHDGTLETTGGPIRGSVLFERYGTTAMFRDAALVASTRSFALWRSSGVARLGMLQTGRYPDGWLAPGGYLAFWPRAGRRLHGIVSFTLSLPRAFAPARLTFGHDTSTIRPGASRKVSMCIDTTREWRVLFHGDTSFLPDFRHVSAQETAPTFTPDASCVPARP
jgi:hypothetical protein